MTLLFLVHKHNMVMLCSHRDLDTHDPCTTIAAWIIWNDHLLVSSHMTFYMKGVCTSCICMLLHSSSGLILGHFLTDSCRVAGHAANDETLR